MDILQNKSQQAKIIEDRVVKLDKKLKIKFSSCFNSVRNAFLALDTDYDGYITVEDILKYFGNETDLNYNDLKKLIMDRDERGLGRLGYKDFSKWLGNTIK
jgi:Ca2+-binding EF-hand superfamily protein